MKHALLVNHEMNEIVFEGRNKAYGAYVLRDQYESHMAKGMLTGLLFFISCIASPYAYYYFKGQSILPDEIIYVSTPVILQNVDRTPVIKKPVLPTSVLPQQQKPQIKFVPPVVVPDVTDIVEDMPPGVDDIRNNDIGTQTQTNDNGTVDAGLIIDTPGTTDVNVAIPDPTVFNSYAVEQQPEFPDGSEAMYKFLRKNLDYPSLAKEIGLSGIVYVQFVVSKEGRIENATILRGVGGGLDQEALRVIRLMPVWRPGKHNGQPVAVYFTLPIKFQLLK